MAIVGDGVGDADLEDVLEAFQGNGDDFGVGHAEEVAEGRDAPLVHEELDLIVRPARCGVGDGPGGLLADVELGLLEELDEGRDDVVVDDGLDLVLVARGDVGDGPAGLLANALFGVGEEGEEAGEGVVVDDELGLEVGAGDDVADGAEGGGLHGRGGVHEELDEAAADAGLDDGLDLLVGSVGEVGQRPAGVGEDLLVLLVDELGEGRQGGAHAVEVRLGLAAAKVGQGPGGVAQHGHFGLALELHEQRLHGARVEHQVAAGRGVAGDVAQGPHGLLPHVVVGAHEESDEGGHGAVLDDHLGVLGRPGCDVGEGPGGLELQRGRVVPLQELNEARDHARVDDLLDGRVLLEREQAAELRRVLRLHGRVVAHDARHHLRQLLQLGQVRAAGQAGHARRGAVHAHGHGHGHGRRHGRGRAAQGPRRGLAAFRQAVFLFGFADLERGFFAAAAGFFQVHSLLESLLALWWDRVAWRGVGWSSMVGEDGCE